jgi:hypothetical protein
MFDGNGNVVWQVSQSCDLSAKVINAAFVVLDEEALASSSKL